MYLMLQTTNVYIHIYVCECVYVNYLRGPKTLQLQPVLGITEPLKFPLCRPRGGWGGWPCETVPMCCRALTEWNMSTRCQRQQASCLVISMLSAYRVYVLLLAAHTLGTGLELSQCHRYGQPFIAAFVRSVWLFLRLKCKITFRNPAAADD